VLRAGIKLNLAVCLLNTKIIFSIKKGSTRNIMQDHFKSPFKLKNAVTVEMPQYMIRNPNIVVRNEKAQLG
jgi:hypothetical protein